MERYSPRYETPLKINVPPQLASKWRHTPDTRCNTADVNKLTCNHDSGVQISNVSL